MIYKTLHRKLKVEQHEPHSKPGVKSGTPKRTKGQKDKQRSTKHTHKTKDGVTLTPLEIVY
jgi:hypothetical protein